MSISAARRITSRLIKPSSWSYTLSSVDRRPLCHRSSPPSPNQVIFSGIQPTGVPHLGNYLGALQSWVGLQNNSPLSTKLLYSIVDLHAITMPQNAAMLRQWRREALATLLAVGLDPARSVLFYQSSVTQHAELMWILSCTASMGYLARMTQWKSKMHVDEKSSPLDTGSKSKLKLGLFSYPVLQAADILVHGATHVPVGEDQSQHLEFARECATNFNASYSDTLVEPATILSAARRVMSLQQPHLKMSKSHKDPRSRILLTDSSSAVHTKIMAALTDSANHVSYDPEARPGVSNLLCLLSYFDMSGAGPADLAEKYSTLNLKQFKILIAETIDQAIGVIRERYETLIAEDDGRYLDHVAADGARRASESAELTMKKVREAVGFTMP